MHNFTKKKKPTPLRGECRHQNGVLGEFKRRVDVAVVGWLGVREGTHLLGECPFTLKTFTCKNKIFYEFLNGFSVPHFLWFHV
ncbi:hypothetical protein Hanom_Chr11g01034821 [Helianthus anomalus]